MCETTSVTWRFLQPLLKRFSRKPIYVPNLDLYTFSTIVLLNVLEYKTAFRVYLAPRAAEIWPGAVIKMVEMSFSYVSTCTVPMVGAKGNLFKFTFKVLADSNNDVICWSYTILDRQKIGDLSFCEMTKKDRLNLSRCRKKYRPLGRCN